MVERVAKVLAARKWPHVGGAAGDSLVTGTPNWKFCVGDARAVIEALMEPTKPMVFFGMDAMARDDLEPTEDEFRAGFVAAIRTALGDQFAALSQPNEEGEGK